MQSNQKQSKERKENNPCLKVDAVVDQSQLEKEKEQKKVLSDIDLELIKKWEGYRETAYKCSAGKWTVGYGSTFLISKNRSVKEGDILDKVEAEKELRNHVENNILKKLNSIEDSYGIIPSQLKTALISLAYNVGVSCFNSQVFRKALQENNVNEMASWFRMWRLVAGEVSEGLVNRRKDEVALFEHIIWR